MRTHLRSALLAIVIAAAASTAAHAACATEEMAGVWVNTDPHATGLSKVEVEFPCYGPNESGPSAYVHAYGVCRRNGCYWGRAAAHQATWSAADGHYTRLDVRYTPGHAVKHLTLLHLARIRLLVFSDVRFPGGVRPGYTRVEYFRPLRSPIVLREDNGSRILKVGGSREAEGSQAHSANENCLRSREGKEPS